MGWPKELMKLITFTELQYVVCNECSGGALETEYNIYSPLVNIFDDDKSGFLGDRYIARITDKCLKWLPKELAEDLERIKDEKKKKRKMTVLIYEEQKKQYRERGRQLEHVLRMPISPLKIDLLIEELNK
jgi:hypothetical protein